MTILFRVLMFIVGTMFGSFLCCQAHRLRRRELKQKPLGHRSVCLHCNHQLKWYENLPLISWLIQRGKCKRCGKKIGLLDFLSELFAGLAFLCLSFTIDPLTATTPDYIIFVLTLLLFLPLLFLAIYDGEWGELPTFAIIIAAVFAIILSVYKLYLASFSTEQLLNTVFAGAILGGLYLVLYLISKGKWVGDGDWCLAGIIGISLGAPFSALVVLFIANFSACLVMYPTIRKSKSKKIFFGPFLVAAFIITLALCDIIKL